MEVVTAKTLKALADTAHADENTTLVASAMNTIITKCTNAARKGSYQLRITLRELGLGNVAAARVVQKLTEQGFEVRHTDEIIAWYSNTDYDSEPVFEISWLKA